MLNLDVRVGDLVMVGDAAIYVDHIYAVRSGIERVPQCAPKNCLALRIEAGIDTKIKLIKARDIKNQGDRKDEWAGATHKE